MIPIFIGGCSRSGTTLLGAMLGGGPESVATPESPFKIHPLACRFIRRSGRLTAQDVLDALSDWFFAIWDLRLPDEQMGNAQAWLDSPDTLAGGPSPVARVMQKLVEAYAAKLGKPHFRYWIDHTPANIRYARTLLEHFPNAKILHLVRDGRAVAASVMKLDWGPNTAKEAARWWTSYVSMGLAAEHALAPDQILRVRYEDLIGAPRETLQRVCAFCGLAPHPRMLEANGFRVPAYTAQQHRLVGGPLRSDRMAAWRQELAPRDVEIFEYYTGDALAYLGYPLQYGLGASPPTVYEKWDMELRELTRRTVNKCFFAWRKKRYAA